MFSGIREAINNLSSAIRNRQKAKQQNREEPPGAKAIGTPNDDAQHARTYREKGHTVQKVIAVATIGAFISASIYAYLAWEQKCIMNQTYTEVQKQTKAAECAAKASQDAATASISEAQTASDALIIQNRPWLSLKSINCDACWTITGGSSRGISVQDDLNHLQGKIGMSILTAEVVNTGKTPAQDVTIDFTFHYGVVASMIGNCKMNISTPCLPSQFDTRNFTGIADLPISTVHQHPIYAGVIAPSEGIPIVFGGGTHIISVPDISSIPAAYVEGAITYGSTLGVKGVTKFCFYPVFSYGDPAAKKLEQYNYCDNPGSNTMR